MRRFFFRPEERVADDVVLSEEESHHIRTVLRLRTGMHVELLDGNGGIHRAVLMETSGPVRARIITSSVEAEGAGASLRVCQGVLKGKNMDMVIQKCTELGVNEFFPVITGRCQGRPEPDRDRKRHGRWQRIVDEACKQCRRTRPMALLEVAEFPSLINFSAGPSEVLKLLFWEEERDVNLHDLPALQNAGRVSLLLGPEGGFTAQEVAAAKEAGWCSVSLGSRILRAETATLAAVAIIQHYLGTI